jgi:putative glutamine amidotransferase
VTGDHRRWAPSWWCLKLTLLALGASPRRISVRAPAEGEHFDALVVSGGNDVGPELYGGDAQPKARIDRHRDQLEIRWIERAIDEGWPLLGICRGAQLINVVCGGKLIQDLRALRRRTSNRASLLPTKRVELGKDSFLAQLLRRRRLRVNSLHHQAVETPGKGLRMVGRDRDGICQAIEASGSEAVIGVQWHPEYLFYLSSQRRLFRWLMRRAEER